MSFQKEYEEFLCHYGVRGMRWGVRKYIKSVIKGFGKSVGLTAKAGAKFIKKNVRKQNKEQQIKSLKDYLEKTRNEKLQDFIEEERNYLRETGNDTLIKDLGDNKKKWEAHRKEVIRIENKKLKDLMKEQ